MANSKIIMASLLSIALIGPAVVCRCAAQTKYMRPVTDSLEKTDRAAILIRFSMKWGQPGDQIIISANQPLFRDPLIMLFNGVRVERIYNIDHDSAALIMLPACGSGNVPVTIIRSGDTVTKARYQIGAPKYHFLRFGYSPKAQKLISCEEIFAAPKPEGSSQPSGRLWYRIVPHQAGAAYQGEVELYQQPHSGPNHSCNIWSDKVASIAYGCIPLPAADGTFSVRIFHSAVGAASASTKPITTLIVKN